MERSGGTDTVGAPEEELDASRASGCCGRMPSPMHLTELEETLSQRRALARRGEEVACGWLKDKYGLSW
ncbi:MAG: VOC family protein [Pseudonocardiaceae bacterium]